MKQLKTYTTRGPNGIEVVEHVQVKSRFIKDEEFEYLLEIIRKIPTKNISHIYFNVKKIKFEIYKLRDHLRIDNIYIDDAFIYITTNQFKTIFNILNK